MLKPLTPAQKKKIESGGPWVRVLQGSKRTLGKLAKVKDCIEDDEGYWYTLDFGGSIGIMSGFHESRIEIL